MTPDLRNTEGYEPIGVAQLPECRLKPKHVYEIYADPSGLTAAGYSTLELAASR